jgi:hypothetical protein
MRRLPRVILVLATALAAFAAASLQDKVLCYSDCGRHIAFEPPHAGGGCPAGHDGHDHAASHVEPETSHSEAPAPDSDDCTDVTADFPVIRELTGSSIDVERAELPLSPSAVPTNVVSSTPVAVSTRPDRTHGPPPLALACLRTIVLLV